jgi:hypothetical protein
MKEKEKLNELWKELLEQNPNNNDLRYIIEYDSLATLFYFQSTYWIIKLISKIRFIRLAFF